MLNGVSRLTKAHVNIFNSGLEDGCIGIVDFKIYPSNGISLPAHAVEFAGASMSPKGEVSLEFYDPNMPTIPFEMTTGYNNKSVAMDVSDFYREAFGLKTQEWIGLAGFTLKCPIDNSCAIQALKDLDNRSFSLSSVADSSNNQ